MNVLLRTTTGNGRVLAFLTVVTCLAASTGCRLCSNCEIGDYSAYGGAWDRTQRETGRVGSLFDPAGAQLASLVERNEPPTADELERERQAADPDAIRERDEETRRQAEMDEDDRLRHSESDEDRKRRQEERERELDALEIDDIEVSIQDIPLPMLD